MTVGSCSHETVSAVRCLGIARSETHGFRATRRSLTALPLKEESSTNVSRLESFPLTPRLHHARGVAQVNRLQPLIGRDVAFVVADRVGAESCEPVDREGSIMFCGGSCCIDMKGTRLVGRYLDWKAEEVLIVQVLIEPLAAAAATVDREEERVAAAVR